MAAAAYPERWARDRNLALCLAVEGALDVNSAGERQFQLRALRVTYDGCLVRLEHHVLLNSSFYGPSHAGLALVGRSWTALASWYRTGGAGGIVTKSLSLFAPRFPKLSFVGKLPQGATLEWVALRSCGHIQMKFDALLEDTTHSDTPAACQQNIYLQMQHY